MRWPCADIARASGGATYMPVTKPAVATKYMALSAQKTIVGEFTSVRGVFVCVSTARGECSRGGGCGAYLVVRRCISCRRVMSGEVCTRGLFMKRTQCCLLFAFARVRAEDDDSTTPRPPVMFSFCMLYRYSLRVRQYTYSCTFMFFLQPQKAMRWTKHRESSSLTHFDAFVTRATLCPEPHTGTENPWRPLAR